MSEGEFVVDYGDRSEHVCLVFYGGSVGASCEIHQNKLPEAIERLTEKAVSRGVIPDPATFMEAHRALREVVRIAIEEIDDESFDDAIRTIDRSGRGALALCDAAEGEQ